MANVDCLGSVDKTLHFTRNIYSSFIHKQPSVRRHGYTHIGLATRCLYFQRQAHVYLGVPRHKARPCAGAGAYYSNTCSPGTLQ